MIKRKDFILMSMIIGIMFFSSCSHTVYTNSWQTVDFTVLRKSETTEPLRFYDSKSKLQYEVSNDYKNLFILIKATDQQSQMKILRAGMTVGIDTLAKKKPQVEILFPFPSSHDKNSSTTGEKKDWHKTDTSSQKKHFMAQYKEIHLSGFKSPINGILPLHNDYGIYVNITWDSLNIMYYKAIIPFKTFYKDSLTASDSIKIFDFAVNINALTMQHSEGEESGSHGGGMHGGGMHGGGMHGGGGGHYSSGEGGTGDRSSLFEATKFNSRMKLALQPQQK
jgi:uncharacterized membrane protein YgcG